MIEQDSVSKYVVRRAEVRDIPAIGAIEMLSFSSSWPTSAYKREIEKNQMGYYTVAVRTPAAGEARREPRFDLVDEDRSQSEGMLSRLAKKLRGDERRFQPEDAAELETVVGYAGLWLMVDTAHITTIAVDPPYRGEGVGELLLVAMIDHSIEMAAMEVTLEVRVSNYIAQALYRKYTFHNSGIRKRYYSDDGEDALIMTTDSLSSQNFQLVMNQNRDRLSERMAADG